jgi:hypothetical protein
LVSGNSIIGKRDVTAIGIASVIHHTAIHNVDAKTALASLLSPSGWKNWSVRKNRIGPKNKPIFLESGGIVLFKDI